MYLFVCVHASVVFDCDRSKIMHPDISDHAYMSSSHHAPRWWNDEVLFTPWNNKCLLLKKREGLAPSVYEIGVVHEHHVVRHPVVIALLDIHLIRIRLGNMIPWHIRRYIGMSIFGMWQTKVLTRVSSSSLLSFPTPDQFHSLLARDAHE